VAKEKEAYYFSHDSNARNDPKIGVMRCVYGSEGYGWYWMLIEMMREQSEYKLGIQSKYAYRAFALQLQCDSEIAEKFISDCINEFGLFESDGKSFWSSSLVRRMTKMSEKSKAASDSAKGKWKSNESLPNAYETSAQTRAARLSEARKKGSHTKREWEEMKVFFHDTCVKCLGTSELNGVVKNHIIPIYQGGSDSIKNIQPLCARCNASKGPENIDYRIYYCAKKGLVMPGHWTDERLPNAYEMPSINESKVNEIKEKESKSISTDAAAETDPYIELIDYFCSLHKKGDWQLKEKERAAMKTLLSNGVPLTFIVTTMKKIHDDRTTAGERITSFAYYYDPIMDAWKVGVSSEEYRGRSKGAGFGGNTPPSGSESITGGQLGWIGKERREKRQMPEM
jgi:hypothetical protein